MNVVVIDGQGGRMGAQIIEGVRAAGLPLEITAIGTNVLATSAMLKAGANRGATGENPVVVACREADVIVGPIGILARNGEEKHRQFIERWIPLENRYFAGTRITERCDMQLAMEEDT